jgi:hypothetical protein
VTVQVPAAERARALLSAVDDECDILPGALPVVVWNLVVIGAGYSPPHEDALPSVLALADLSAAATGLLRELLTERELLLNQLGRIDTDQLCTAEARCTLARSHDGPHTYSNGQRLWR